MKRLLSSVLVVFLLLTAACSGQGGSAPQAAAPGAPAQGGGFASISPVDAQKMMQSRSDVLLVDVRQPDELREGSIKGAVLMPFFQVMKGQHDLPKDKPIILVCAVGGRSYAAGQILSSQGYREVYNLSGGMANWKKAGLPVEYK